MTRAAPSTWILPDGSRIHGVPSKEAWKGLSAGEKLSLLTIGYEREVRVVLPIREWSAVERRLRRLPYGGRKARAARRWLRQYRNEARRVQYRTKEPIRW